MALKMTASTTSASNTAQQFNTPGTYRMTLISARISLGTEFEDKTKSYPQVRMIWAGRDAAGNEFEFADSFIRIPLNFELNPAAKWTSRLAALVGRDLTPADADELEMDLNVPVSFYQHLHTIVASGVTVSVTQLTHSGISLIGRDAVLTLTLNNAGRLACATAGSKPVPQPAPQPVAQPVAQPAQPAAPLDF